MPAVTEISAVPRTPLTINVSSSGGANTVINPDNKQSVSTATKSQTISDTKVIQIVSKSESTMTAVESGTHGASTSNAEEQYDPESRAQSGDIAVAPQNLESTTAVQQQSNQESIPAQALGIATVFDPREETANNAPIAPLADANVTSEDATIFPETVDMKDFKEFVLK